MTQLPQRFQDKIQPEPTSGCWLWLGAVTSTGYGNVMLMKGGKKTYHKAHRAVYEFLEGPIPEGLVLDHTCCNKVCVNPSHLRPCTQQENLLAPYSVASCATYARRTHCDRGHPLSGENLTTFKARGRDTRRCLTCTSGTTRRYKQKAQVSL